VRKWDSEILENNHIRLMKCHLGVVAFYLAAFSLLVWWEETGVGRLIISVVFAVPVSVHLLLAYGSYKRVELSRKVSEFIFATLILAFPIGTVLAMFLFLPATTWEAPDA
jgi:hypothetical protein